MLPEFWIERWREGRIGFHEGKPNTLLTAHVARLGARVLVPMCGKTADLAFLAAAGREVIGVELVDDAVRAFFAEHALTPTITPRGALTAYVAGPITILSGDLFEVTVDEVGPIDAVYDRAAMIALPAELRTRYVAQLRALVPAGTPTLLITIDYPQDQIEGPPFAVTDAEVRARLGDVEELAARPATGRIAESGVPVTERCYLAAL